MSAGNFLRCGVQLPLVAVLVFLEVLFKHAQLFVVVQFVVNRAIKKVLKCPTSFRLNWAKIKLVMSASGLIEC